MIILLTLLIPQIMNLNDFTQFFDNPAVSVFNRSQSKSFPMKIGALYPAKWELLSFGNSQKSNSAHSMRLAPLVAPSFTDLQFQHHAAVIPLRTIIKDYEEVFNYAKNREGSALPAISIFDYHGILRSMCNVGLNPVGSLLDFLGYPVFGDLYKSISWDNFTVDYSVNNDTISISVFDSVPYSYIINTYSQVGMSIYGITTYRGSDIEIFEGLPFIVWLVSQTYNIYLSSLDDYTTYVRRFYSSIPGALNPDGSISQSFTPSLDDLVRASIFSTSKDAIDSYKTYLFGQVLSVFFDNSDLESDPYTALPLMAFWRFYYDWNTNGNFINRDVMLQEDVYDFVPTITELYADVHMSDRREHFRRLLTVPNRLWNDDFFTSLLPTSTVDNAVEIPANSTVLDLASLSSWQKFIFRLSYSSRYRDVVWNVFKIKPSDARLVQSYPIFRSYENVGIGEVNQTSSSDVSGVLGGFAGRGYSSGRNKGYNIFCEEPCIIFDFVSLMPRAKYADALHPLIHVDDILDFPIPDMDVLGNQPIRSDLISGFPGDNSTIMGYGRQYQEWLFNYSTVHGDFKTTLDYWTIARRFSDTPVINEDFLRIHPADDLDVIFSLKNENHAFVDVYYNAKVTRHVHRNVRIKI